MTAEAVGSVEDEARRLRDALARHRAGSSRGEGPEGTSGASASSSVDEALATARERAPRVLRGLADAASLLAEGLRVAADAIERSPGVGADLDDVGSSGGEGAARYRSSGDPTS